MQVEIDVSPAYIHVKIVVEVQQDVQVPNVGSLLKEETIEIIVLVKMDTILKEMTVYRVEYHAQDVQMP